MPQQDEAIDPTDVAGIDERALSWSPPGTTVCPIGIDRIIVSEDAVEDLVGEVLAVAESGSVLLVVDRTPMKRNGEDLKSLISDALGRVVRLAVRRLPDDSHESGIADLETARRLSSEVRESSVVVSVGSGSVTDAVKYARNLAVQDADRKLPFVCFPTAASVTAYTSSLAVWNAQSGSGLRN